MRRTGRRKEGKAPEVVFIAAVGILIVLGLFLLASASAPVGFERFGDKYFFLKRQILSGIVPGLLGLSVLAFVPYKWFRRFTWLYYVATLVLLMMVFIPGLGADFGSAQSWISLGPISLQPAEFAKITFILFLASWFDTRGRQGMQRLWQDFVPFVALLAIPLFMLVKQPDTGTMAIFLAAALVMIFVARVKISHLAILGGLIAVALAGLIASAPYRAERIMTFLHPELDPQGVGYHINQAFLAIGSGGLFGQGYGNSRQKYQYLPEVSADSIFAVTAEELGFVFSTIIIVLIVFVFFRGMRIGRKSSDQFGLYLGIGLASWYGLQSLINIGAMLGLLPLTGVPLPLISHGGSAMVAMLLGFGILINISRHNREVE